MKLIISILIAGIFTLLGIMKLHGYFDLGVINLINLDGTFDTDLSFIQNTAEYLFYIPELIFNSEKDLIKEYFLQYTIISDNEVYILVIFLFHFISIFIIFNILRVFPSYKDKQYLTYGIIITYLVSIYIIEKMTNI